MLFQTHISDPALKNTIRSENGRPLTDNTITGKMKRNLAGLRHLLDENDENI